MNKITKFGNTGDFRKIRELFKEKMEEIYEETGVLINMESISYNDFTFTSKISAKIVTSGNIEDAKKEAMEVEWNANCYKYRLKPEDFGKTFTNNMNTYTIHGLLSRKSKNGILVKKSGENKIYKINAELVHSKLYPKTSIR